MAPRRHGPAASSREDAACPRDHHSDACIGRALYPDHRTSLEEVSVVPPTQNQTDKPHTEATYGGLLTLAADDAARARCSAIGPFEDADLAAKTVGDFERFLAVVGHHLELLLAPAAVAHPRPMAHQQLANALSALRSERHGDNAWTSAGDHLGITHDLLATHVGPTGEFRTSEAVLLATRRCRTRPRPG